jgi:hypothetical protein
MPNSIRILHKIFLLTESYTFLKSTNIWFIASLYSHFFSSVWWMQNIRSVVDLLYWNLHRWSPIISSAYGVNLDRRIFDTTLYVADKWCAAIVTTVCFITLLINRYNDWLLPLLRQFLFIPNRVNKFMDLKANFSTSCFNHFCLNVING